MNPTRALTETPRTTRRGFLAAAAASSALALPLMRPSRTVGAEPPTDEARPPARIAITLDLEMSRHYPRRGMTEWDYRKGDLDQATKDYTVRAAEVVRSYGGVIHLFVVGRTLEQADVAWLKQLHEDGHPLGNHTYDHVNLMARTAEEVQYRFRRAPWLIEGRRVAEVLRENIDKTTRAMKQRLGVAPNGFRTPGGFSQGLAERPDLQEMLLDAGFTWVSSKYPPHPRSKPGEEPSPGILQGIVNALAEAQPFRYPSGLIEVPMSPISDVTAFRSARWKRASFIDAIEKAVAWTIENRAVYDFLAHPSCMVVEDPECETFHRICRQVQQAGPAARLVSLDQIV